MICLINLLQVTLAFWALSNMMGSFGVMVLSSPGFPFYRWGLWTLKVISEDSFWFGCWWKNIRRHTLPTSGFWSWLRTYITRTGFCPDSRVTQNELCDQVPFCSFCELFHPYKLACIFTFGYWWAQKVSKENCIDPKRCNVSVARACGVPVLFSNLLIILVLKSMILNKSVFSFFKFLVLIHGKSSWDLFSYFLVLSISHVSGTL